MVKAEEGSRMRQVMAGAPLLVHRVAVAVWLLGAVIVLGQLPSVAAATLEALPDQVLEPGQQLQLPLQIRQEQGPRIEISLGVSPPGASLELQDDGQLQLQWQPGPDMPPETMVELLVRDVDSNVYLDSVFVVIRRPDVNPRPDGGPGTGVMAPEPSTEVLPDGSLDAPVLDVLPNQVVSAGRTVTLKVFASLPGEFDPVLQIDRLPRNASFEANEEGGRTFRWETGDNDQGEHLFRFTAFNPRAPEQRSVQEVLMVVGDPSLKVTLPQPTPSD
ncbi:hypothetical protein ACUNV4_03125 [Granulosicoccus sp. 3-233]|uniref:hypothetical protein n=1 Tax=Granulosicoccus sp. 3-233 TaxID=3417969 RepID=UPI003D33D857